MTKGPRHENLYVLKDSEFVAFYSNRQVMASDLVWHRRLAHANSQVLQHLKKIKAISTNKSNESTLCEPCQMGKSSKLPFFTSLSLSMTPLDKIHRDLWGPSPIVSNQGFKYYAILVDDYSRFSWLFPLKCKSDFFQVFVNFQKQVQKQYNTKIKVFQSDGGGEFTSHLLRNHLASQGIQHQLSCPSTPQQNGLAERKHRHLTELALSMMFQIKVPFKYWVEAFYTANFVSNLLPSSAVNFLTPHELLNKSAPDYSFLRVFGSACYPCLRPYTNQKFNPRSLQCIFLGYHAQYKGYRCLYPPTGRIYISRHVSFDEESFLFADRYRDFVDPATTPLMKAWQSAPPSPLHLPTAYVPPVFRAPTPNQPNIDTSDSSSSDESFEEPRPETEPSISPEPAVIRNHPMTTRLQSGIRKPNPRYALLASKVIPTIPRTTASALKHEGWRRSMTDEMDAQQQNGTMSLVPRRSNMNVLGSRWIHTVKLNPDGSVLKLKSRWVAKGYEQEEGIDFVETYSPVVRTTTIRVVLGVAVAKEWTIRQLDVRNAFLHGELQEEVYVEQPPGFENPNYPNHVCKLHKALYGLKQAPRAWFNKFANFLLEFGFKCSPADPSLFTYHRGTDSMALLLYVDDVLITGNSSALIDCLISTLSSSFAMKDMGPINYFLGIKAQFHEKGLFLDQTAYAEEILREAAMDTANPMPTPLPTRLDAAFKDTELFPQPSYFRSIAGKLQT